MRPAFSNPQGAELVAAAVEFARMAHGEQKRKYTGQPYWTHPLEVMQILEKYGASPEVRAAAMLHDVLEDTDTKPSEILERFGPRVLELVLEVTDVSSEADGNRAQRKRKDLVHLSKATPWAAMIKLADLISNTQSIVENDPGFAKIYLREKEDLLKVLNAADMRLHARAAEVLWQAKKKLEASHA